MSTPSPDYEERWTGLRRRLAELTAASTPAESAEARAERLRRRAATLNRRPVAEAGERLPYLFFRHGPDRFGLPAESVLQIQPIVGYSVVPRTPPFLRGVLHVQGQLLALLDLRRLLQLTEEGLADVHLCLVVGAAGHTVALMAGDAEDVAWLRPADLHPAPESSVGIPSEWFSGLTADRRMILDPAAIFSSSRLTDWRQQ